MQSIAGVEKNQDYRVVIVCLTFLGIFFFF